MTENRRMKKILFVTPPYHGGIAEVTGRWLPLNFVYLAGVAREAGLSAGIYDAMAKDHGHPEIEKHLLESSADYVAVTAITATIADAIKVLVLAKSSKPDTVTILGGIHPTYMYDAVLKGSDAVDFIIMGEGEVTLRHLLTVLEEGGDPATVPGLAFRRNGAIVTTEKRGVVTDIDDLPVAWDLLEWTDYTYHVIPGSRLGAISTSRGCDRDCLFCSQRKFWEKSWRCRDPRKVVDELEYLHRTYDVNVFLITDEYPTRSRERWEAFLDVLVNRELPVHLLMETWPADIIRDRDIIGKYRQAGIIHVSIGIESTDQGRLDLLGKEMTGDQARQALELLHSHGIVSEASFLLGFPDETNDSIKRALQQAQSLNPDIANFMALTPWPYADMYEQYKPYITVHDYSKYNLIDPVMTPEGMSMLQIEVAIIDCFRKFNMAKIMDIMTMKKDFRRDYLLRASKLMMGSSFIMKKMGTNILGKLKLIG